MRALLGSPARRWAALALAVVIVAAAAIAFWPRSSAAPIAAQQLTIQGAKATWDSAPVQLDATVYLPASTPAPAVIIAHGFGGSKASVAGDAENLARAGFVVLAYSARGFGKSTGTISLDSLDAEVPDARKLVDYLATRSDVIKDAPGDPRVGVTGGSYGGALSLMLAGTDPRIDAAVPVITWNNLQQALFPNAVLPNTFHDPGTPAAIPASDDGVFKKYWAAALISSVVTGANLAPTAAVDIGPSNDTGGRRDNTSGVTAGPAARATSAGSSDPVGPAAASAGCGRLRPQVCAAYAQAASTGRIDTPLRALLARSSPSAVDSKITAPTLLVQGEKDTLFPLDQADANAREIAAAGTTVAVDWYRGGHDGGAPDASTQNRITGWLQHYLKAGPGNAAPGPTGTSPAPSLAFQYSVDGGLTDNGRARSRVLQTAGYAGVAGDGQVTRRRIPLSGGAQLMLNPPGGTPAAISSLPGLGAAGALTSLLSQGLPGQTASFSSAPFSALTVVTGAGRLQLTLIGLPSAATGSGTGPAGGPVLFGSIGSRTNGGVTTMGGNAVAPIRLPPLPADGSQVTVTVALPAVSLQVAAGESLVVRFSTTDQAYAGPTSPAAYRISGVNSVSVPTAGGQQVSAGEIPIDTLIALIALAVLAVAGLLLAGRWRQRPRATANAAVHSNTEPAADTAAVDGGPEPPVLDPTVVPLVIQNLSKSYPGGVQAVRDVSFDARPGQVLGLLGPNGAGKTTTLRMVMGLIRPTGGEISVFGRPVTPGAEILSRVGSFVEGSGFLPHLSGRVNLELYWKATGRPAADSHLDQVLVIAGLGTAVRRKVKTYSQGMRQRLAIAQSMLGLPDLLLLDEPTNGLDPPQIHAMREVLRRYAATGRAVVLSSHLLSEVEQTCGEVVVIHLGRTIAAGRVADLIASSGEMSFTVDDANSAATLLRRMGGVGDVEVVDGAVQVDLGAVRSAQVVDSLVRAGIAVSAATPRNRLEDVFLDLVGATGSAGKKEES
ncbi:MAG: alpha/beta fold hydrolase [Actinomycetota bacterium]|nr:alpha/beta fold hydrolase [Actinomycetota bacterium]